MEIIIIPLHFSHLEAVAALEQRCFSDPWSEAGFLGELDNPVAVYFIAEQQGTVVGYAGMHAILDEGHITNVAVSPDCRRHGIGKTLAETLIREAGRRGLRSLTLEVRESNGAARALYRKLGFADVGRRRGYYQSPAEDAVLMTKELAGNL